MRNLLATLMIVFLLFFSTSAEAGLFSVTKKILRGAADFLDENPGVLLHLGIKVKRNLLENKRASEEEKRRKEKALFGDGDKFLPFPSQRSTREAVKCEANKRKKVLRHGAYVYKRPDLESSILGTFEPFEWICIKRVGWGMTQRGWRMTQFGWLEEKSFFSLDERAKRIKQRIKQ